MSDLNLTFTPQMLTRQLALEAATNPLGAMSEAMTTKYSVLLSRLNVLKMQVADVRVGMQSRREFNPRPIPKLCRQYNYMELSSVPVSCPAGFIGPMKGYMTTLIKGLEEMTQIRQTVLAPIQTEIGLLLANPERLSKASPGKPQSVSDTLTHKDRIEAEIQRYYNPKADKDHVNFNRLFTANSDFIDCGHLTQTLERHLKKARETLQSIETDIANISQLSDKLAVRISQGDKNYQLNNVVAAQIAQLLIDGATSISFLTALTVMGYEATGVMVSVVDTVQEI